MKLRNIVLWVFNLRFPRRRYDAATGLYYNYYRDYDPGAGRYIQVDSIRLDWRVG
jgi:RHS repeat-associated protein